MNGRPLRSFLLIQESMYLFFVRMVTSRKPFIFITTQRRKSGIVFLILKINIEGECRPCLSKNRKKDCHRPLVSVASAPVDYTLFGQVAEWSNAHAWKACEAEMSPRVRIPPCPPSPPPSMLGGGDGV